MTVQTVYEQSNKMQQVRYRIAYMLSLTAGVEIRCARSAQDMLTPTRCMWLNDTEHVTHLQGMCQSLM